MECPVTPIPVDETQMALKFGIKKPRDLVGSGVGMTCRPVSRAIARFPACGGPPAGDQGAINAKFSHSQWVGGAESLQTHYS